MDSRRSFPSDSVFSSFTVCSLHCLTLLSLILRHSYPCELLNTLRVSGIDSSTSNQAWQKFLCGQFRQWARSLKHLLAGSIPTEEFPSVTYPGLHHVMFTSVSPQVAWDCSLSPSPLCSILGSTLMFDSHVSMRHNELHCRPSGSSLGQPAQQSCWTASLNQYWKYLHLT